MTFTHAGRGSSANPEREASLRTGAAAAAVFVTAVGVLDLAGWWLDITAFTRVLSQWPAMRPTTAVGFLLAGLALWWLCSPLPGGRAHRAGRGCAGAVVLLGLLSLTLWLGDWDWSLGTLLFDAAGAGEVPNPPPVQMAPPPDPAFALIFCGLALLTLDGGARPGRRPAELLILPPLAMAYVALLGYLYGATALYQVLPYASVAVHTATGFLVLGVGVLCARPERGWMALIAGNTAGGNLVRRLLPTLLLILPLLGWLGLAGERAGWYGTSFGVALVVLAGVLVLVVVVWRSARALDRAETGRQRAEAARRQSEGQLRLFVEHAPAASAMFDREMRYLSASRRWLDDYGLGERDLRGLSHYAVFPEIPERWRELHHRALGGEVLSAEEDPFLRADGSVQWLRWEIRPWRDAAGAVAGIVVFSEDITAHKQVQEALCASERRYRILTEVSPQFVWMADAHGACTYANQCWFDYTGLSAEQTMGQGWNQAVEPSQRERIAAAWRQAAARGTWNEEILFRRAADGHYRWHQSRAAAVRDEHGQIQQWIGSTIDIHDLKVAEDLNRRTLQALPAHIAVLDRRGRIIAVNQAWTDFATANGAGDSPAVAVGANYLAVCRCSGATDDPESTRALAGIEGVLAGTLPRFTLEYPCHSPAEQRWFLLTAAPLGPDGGAVLTHLNITERKRYEHELAQARAAAESANAAKGEFLAHMSHEIRTPLNVVLGLAQLLHRESLAPNQHDMVERIQSAGQSLLTILNDVLDISKIEAGQLRIEPRPFDLGVLLAKLDDFLRPSAQAKGLTLRVQAPATAPWPLLGDGLRLEQVLINLIVNAIKFTERGEVVLLIQARETDGMGVRLRFEVRDTGIGIAPAALAQLFTPFTQAETGITRRFGGTGLGLSICKQLVELMGGAIGVESQEGQGSCFWFELPFAPVVNGVCDATAATPAPPPGPRLVGVHVLVADDSAMSRDLLEQALALEGATTTLAADGQQALQHLKARPTGFDAVLMDVRMPVMNGLTATALIRRELDLAALPIIALTAGVLPAEHAAARAAGVTDVLVKPLELEQMTALLLKWVKPGSAAPPQSGPLAPPTATPA